MQDSWDIWDNHMPVTNVANGHIIGYKYFGFGGLDRDTNGLKAFKGTRPGNRTMLELFLTPTTAKAFKVNVWLDGPWDNDTWNGKKIAEINVRQTQHRQPPASLLTYRPQSIVLTVNMLSTWLPKAMSRAASSISPDWDSAQRNRS